MLTRKDLEQRLTEAGCAFAILCHPEPIYTVEQADRYFDRTKAAPVFILESDRGAVAFLASGAHGRYDWKEVAEAAGLQKLKLASAKRVEELTGYAPGEVPLIGHGLPCLVDRGLLSCDVVYGGTGDPLHTLQIDPNDLIRMSKVLSLV